MSLGIIKNPLADLLPALVSAPVDPSHPNAASEANDALKDVVAFARLLVSAEWHDETILATATQIPHQLGRVPRMLLMVAPIEGGGTNVFVPAPGVDGLWTDRHIVLQRTAGFGDRRARFLLL